MTFRSLLVGIAVFSLITPYAHSQHCNDIGFAGTLSPRPSSKRADQMKIKLEHMEPLFSKCKKDLIGKYPQFTNSNSNLGIVFRIDKYGDMQTSYKCANNIRESSSIEEAQYNLDLTECYLRLLSKVEMNELPSSSKNEIVYLCWDGKFPIKEKDAATLKSPQGSR